MGKLQSRLAGQLSTYVRYLAWLQAVPKPDPKSKRAKEAEEQPRICRLDQFKIQKIQPPMPHNPAPHIVDRLIEIGLVESNGMGVGPLSWREINQWCDSTRVDLSPWDRRLLRRLSNDYVAWSRLGEDEACPPPWKAPVTQVEINTEVDRLRDVLG